MKFVLAPLAGFTDAPFRRICFEGGADLTYTEMVSAAALAHGHGPTRHLLATMPCEGSVACQIFGATESDIAHATRTIGEIQSSSSRFTSLDLNAGCPMTKVTRCGAGAELVKDPAKIARLLKAMTENTDMPVTLKTRLGPNPRETMIFEILDAATQAGASGITIHARYTSQMHGGEVHLGMLEEVVKRATIPVTGNGGVIDRVSARRMASTGVSAIMVGRAALAHPDLFGVLKGAKRDVARFSVADAGLVSRHLSYLLAFRDRLVSEFPNDHIPSADGYASVKMHTHLFRYFNGLPGAAALRARLNRVRTLAEIREIISSFGVAESDRV